MKKFVSLMLLIGMIGCIAPIQGGAQNPWNYQRTIRVTDSLVEVFEGDQPIILLDSYVGPVKGTSIWANEWHVSPSELERTRFMSKNGQTFWIDMNEIQGLSEIWGLGGSDPATIHLDNMIEVWGAGMVAFYYKANGEKFYVSSHVNYFGVTQWDGADLLSETILVVEEGSLYLAESELIGVPEWEADGMWWYNYNISNPTNSILLFDYTNIVSVGELLNTAISSSNYGDSFVLYVGFDDGTSNGINYSHNHELFTVIDNRQVKVESVTLSPSTAVLVKEEQLQLTATVLPENATHPDLLWTSGDLEIASVSQNGLVTALSPGTVSIRATAQDGSNIFGEAELTVVLPEYQLSFSWGDGGILTALVDDEVITSPTVLEEGTVVNFIAIPSSNYVIKEWILNGVVVDTTSYELNLEIDRDYQVLVEFKLKVGVEETAPQLFPQYTEGVVRGSGILRVYDLSGRVLLSREINGYLTLPQLPSGVYVLQVGSWRKKVFLR